MLDQSLIRRFKKIVTKICEIWRIPNITYALIKDSQIIDIQSCVLDDYFHHNVSAEKLFKIGSNSKAFVCTALAELEKQSKLSFDDKVTDYLPDFKMYTDELTAQVKVRNLVTHSTGIGKFTSCLLACLDYPEESIISSLKHLKPIAPFNKSFQYNNALYVVAGKIIEKITGIDCRHYFKKQFFIPLEMGSTYTSVADIYQPLLAVPYIEYNKKTFAISQCPTEKAFSVGGNVISNVSDLAKWIVFNLKITAGNKENIAYYQKLFQPQIPIIQPLNINKLNHYLKATAYLMGWQQVRLNKYKIFEHMGMASGYTSNLSFCPELKSGMVVLANKGTLWNQIGLLLINFYELITTNEYSNLFSIVKKQHEKFTDSISAKIGAMKSLPLPDNFKFLSLSYTNPMYNTMEVNSNSEVVTLTIGPKKVNVLLEYIGDGKFRLIDENFNFGELLRLITLHISEGKKTATMEIFMDDQHGSFTWVDSQIFSLSSL